MRDYFDHARMSVMSNFEALLISVCVLSFCSQCLSVESVECGKINGCQCIMPDGIRIDLTRLDGKWYVSLTCHLG